MTRMRRPRGFTLLELLVSIAMSATIAGSLAASLYIAYRARNSAEAAVDAAHVNDAVADIVSRDMVNAVPPNGILASGFYGDAESVRFCATGGESRSAVPGDLKEVEFALVADVEDPARNTLVRRVRTNLLAPVEAEPVDEVICRDVQNLTLAYYDGYAWSETWDSTEHDNTLPYAVELVIVQGQADDAESVRQITRQVRIPCGVLSTEQNSSSGGTSAAGGE